MPQLQCTQLALQAQIVFFLLSQTYQRRPQGFEVKQGHLKASPGASEHTAHIMQRWQCDTKTDDASEREGD